MANATPTPSAHTPGPWIVKKKKDSGVGNRGSHFEILHPLMNTEGKYKGQLGGYHIVVGEKNCQRGLSEADARLIAAAPIGYDASKALLSVVAAARDLDTAIVRLDELESAIFLAEEFIAKAEGRLETKREYQLRMEASDGRMVTVADVRHIEN